ncbi:hypothetical protein RISK_005527 [Rhodopirellula islandica]|uniref:Uncharacterized protein n=1 Tax=Rhodopirellula islandica TaxID=595434 RepID=A0A0J1B7Q0_RHOIS|nr:hypothetical protein RISK_005527 [Rhodopirellula islandica]
MEGRGRWDDGETYTLCMLRAAYSSTLRLQSPKTRNFTRRPRNLADQAGSTVEPRFPQVGGIGVSAREVLDFKRNGLPIWVTWIVIAEIC